MSILFRLLLLSVSTGTLLFVFIKIRRAQMQISSSVFWIIFMLGLVTISAFPGIVIYFSNLFGIISPANFVFLMILFVVMIKLFYLSLHLSKMRYEIQRLTQIIALDNMRKNESSNSTQNEDIHSSQD